MRVLVLADKCNPDWPSLPVVGYKMCKALADHAEVVVATSIRNRTEIERDGMGNATVEFIDNEYIARPLYNFGTKLRGGAKVGWTTSIALEYPTYIAFEREVYKKFKSELKAGKFDVVHRVTPMSPTTVSPMAKWSGDVPFVLGPLNGGLKWPAGFGGERRREKEWLSYLRNAHKLLPYYKSTYHKSAAILASFDHTIDDLPGREKLGDRVFDFPEVGADPEVFGAIEREPVGDRVEFMYVGRLVPYKCPEIIVNAFAKSETLRKHKLTIVGDGIEMDALKKIVEENNLHDCVELAGWMSQAEVGQRMQKADAFVFPSIRELGAGVVVEAMSCGLPCVVVDYGGPGGLVEADRGVKVPLGSRDEILDGFTKEMEGLVNEPQRLRPMGEAARQFVANELTWDRKAQKTMQVYEWITGNRPDRPTLELPPLDAGSAQAGFVTPMKDSA